MKYFSDTYRYLLLAVIFLQFTDKYAVLTKWYYGIGNIKRLSLVIEDLLSVKFLY